MKLKQYQQDTLDTLRTFLETCQLMKAEDAYNTITQEPELRARLDTLRDYTTWPAIPNTPRVCLKVPTGGGKTIIAAHTVKIVANTWLERDFPLVLWFTPSDTIRQQTYNALCEPRHPYRMVLDERFNGNVCIFDIDDKFNIRPTDIANNACIIVSTIQSFRQSDTNKYNVYRHNEHLEPHFSQIRPSTGMESGSNGGILFSFANLLHHHRPVLIVDEAHDVISSLSQDVYGRINPAAIVELTATPQPRNNTLYCVNAIELKAAEMIKLPIDLRELINWESAVSEAIAKRRTLEEAANKALENGDDYVRPILLFQAQNANENVTVDKLKEHLIHVENIPESEIAIVTGDQKELDGINLFEPTCPIKYVITVKALKEGWDCHFAYVLCSLANNIKSDKDILQLLGRIMRMPYARKRKISSLNKAYAYVRSGHFSGEATNDIVRTLKEKGGFDDTEAKAAIIPQAPELPLFGDTGVKYEPNKIILELPLKPSDIPSSMKLGKDGTLEFGATTTAEEIERVADLISPKNADELRYKFALQPPPTPSPAERGERFFVPSLLVAIQGELVFADPEEIFAEYNWKINNIPVQINNFNIEQEGKEFTIFIDNNRLAFREVQDSEQLSLQFNTAVENWTLANLEIEIDRLLHQEDIPHAEMIEWLRRVIKYLMDTRGFSLSTLWLVRFSLERVLRGKINEARLKAKADAAQIYLFKPDAPVKIMFDTGFEFNKDMYADYALEMFTTRKLNKHYLRKIPPIGERGKGEHGDEFACACILDSLPQVKFWLRNIDRHENSFRLPTSTDFFYPDFIALLNDGRILVVEYKGGLTADTKDAEEKTNIGAVWERLSQGRGLYITAEKSKDGLTTEEQIRAKIKALQ